MLAILTRSRASGAKEPDSDRTPDQTDLARFWSDNYVLQWNRALRAIATTYVNTIGDSARLFALANLAAADAIITAWNTKNRFPNWRPITAIQEGDNDGNPCAGALFRVGGKNLPGDHCGRGSGEEGTHVHALLGCVR